MPPATVHRDAFEIGWISALSTEYVAACEILDEEYALGGALSKYDGNTYTFGRLGQHKVVIACLPKSRYGTTSAACVARDMLQSFPSIRFGLMVGVGGGVPSKKHDVRLGDVVVGCPTETSSGVIHYHHGKTIQGKTFVRTGFLSPPPRTLLSALNGLNARHERSGHKIQDTVSRIVANSRLAAKYQSPGWHNDLLFKSAFIHQDDDEDCSDCCAGYRSQQQTRMPRSSAYDDPVIHYGLIASADSVMKDAEVRDKLRKETDVLCFEMEAAGLMDHFPCLVIRGICDYSDSHKNKRWQGYAAATAAAYAKELLVMVPSLGHIEIPKNLSDTHRGLVPLTLREDTMDGSDGIDVVAVHGIGGDAVSSWTAQSGYAWLRDWLAPQVSGVGILSYGYDSKETWNSGTTGVADTALDLLRRLRRQPRRKIVFVCHGLGGVLAKVAISMAKSMPEHSFLTDCLSGIVFLGTPQERLQVTEWMRIVYRMANALMLGQSGRLDFLESLERVSTTLASISYEYQSDIDQVSILSFYETETFAETGTVIVDAEAVILVAAREQLQPVRANHSALATPELDDINDNTEAYTTIVQLVLASMAPALESTAVLLQKLFCVDYEMYSMTVPDACPNTCLWFWDHANVRSWIQKPSCSLLWVNAGPGYGKTVLAKQVARDLKKGDQDTAGTSRFSNYTVLTFFFREDEEARSEVALLRSLLHQILIRYPDTGAHIQRVFDSVNMGTTLEGRQEPCLDSRALRAAFTSVLQNELLSKVVLVIDAVDEADLLDIEHICHELLLTMYARKEASVNDNRDFKILLTSRHNNTLSKQFSGNAFVDILEITPDLTKGDIETFLGNVIGDFGCEQCIPQDDISSIQRVILERAEGMFLWANLAWEHFKEGVVLWSHTMVEQRLKALESLPPGLGALYHKLFDKMRPEVLSGLLPVFLLVVGAARPLSCEETENILGMQGWETRSTEVDCPFSIRSTINTHCPALLKISPIGTIRTVHLSLKEFIRIALLKQEPGALHSRFAKHCLHYLTFTDVRETAMDDLQQSSKDRCLMKRFALYDYVATYLKHHMSFVQPGDNMWIKYSKLVKHYATFHVTSTPSHRHHVNTANYVAPAYYSETPLRHAIRLHGTSLIRKFATAGYDLDEVVHSYISDVIVVANTALHNSISKPDIVAELLDCGASVNSLDYCLRTPLHVAILRGSPKVVKMLLARRDVAVNVRDVEGRTPLHYEATSGGISVLLSDSRVDFAIRDKTGRTAITAAAFWGDYKTTYEFWQSSRVTTDQHDGELSILVAAAQQGWHDFVLEILAQLSDVSNHRGYDGRNILHWAAINNWEDVILTAIFTKNAQVNAVDSRQRTPLHDAAELGHYDIARKLIAHGGSARCQDNQGRSPVQLAATEGFADTVLVLMNSDFNVNDVDRQQRTLVHWAASWDWKIVMRRVIEVPDVNLLKHDCNGRTALHVAALCGCKYVIALLLHEGIFNLNERDSFGNTLLHLAARGRNSAVAKQLLGYDSTFKNSLNRYGQTALDVALSYKAKRVAKVLERGGVRIQKQNEAKPEYHVYTRASVPQVWHDWPLVRWSQPSVPAEEPHKASESEPYGAHLPDRHDSTLDPDFDTSYYSRSSNQYIPTSGTSGREDDCKTRSNPGLMDTSH